MPSLLLGSDFFAVFPLLLVQTIIGLERHITTTYCPNAPFTNLNPNFPYGTVSTYIVPAFPKIHSATTDLSSQGGQVGILFNAAQLFSPYGGPRYGVVTGYANSATAAEGDSFDSCGCHASSTTSPSYHCHVPPSCLLNQLGDTTATHSPQIGWAADGFPVYGPRGIGGVLMQACSLSATGTAATGTCTDDFGGLEMELPQIDSYRMRYYIQGEYNDGTDCTNPTNPLPTADYHPHTPTSYKGCCPTGVACSANFLSACAGESDGYIAAFAATENDEANDLDIDCEACWSSSELGSENSHCDDDGNDDDGDDVVTMAPTVDMAPTVTMAPTVDMAPTVTMAPPVVTAAPVATVAPVATAAPVATTAPVDVGYGIASYLTVNSGDYLTPPEEIGTRVGNVVKIELEIVPAEISGPSAIFTTRLINGMLPGPTWRVSSLLPRL